MRQPWRVIAIGAGSASARVPGVRMGAPAGSDTPRRGCGAGRVTAARPRAWTRRPRPTRNCVRRRLGRALRRYAHAVRQRHHLGHRREQYADRGRPLEHDAFIRLAADFLDHRANSLRSAVELSDRERTQARLLAVLRRVPYSGTICCTRPYSAYKGLPVPVQSCRPSTPATRRPDGAVKRRTLLAWSRSSRALGRSLLGGRNIRHVLTGHPRPYIRLCRTDDFLDVGFDSQIRNMAQATNTA